MLEEHSSTSQAGLRHHKARSLVELDEVAGLIGGPGTPGPGSMPVCAQLSADITGTAFGRDPISQNVLPAACPKGGRPTG